MAKKADNFPDIIKSLRQKEYKPIYILHGEEPYYIDVISNYIESHVLPEEERDFNQLVLYGADTTAAVIADQAKRYPMMSEHQVIIVKEAQAIKKWEQLEAYLDNPQPSSIVVICHKNGKIDGRKKIVAKAQKIGVVYDSVKKYDNELPGFVTNYLQTNHQGVTIEPKAALMVAEHIGNDLSRIASEMDKVVSTLPDNDKRITPEIIENKVGISKEYNGYELREALAVKDVARATRIANYFANDPKSKDSSFTLVPLLFNFFQELMICHYIDGPKTDQNIAQALGMRGAWFARNHAAAVRNYNAMKTLLILSKIRETDAKCKGLDNPNTPIGELLRELVFFILY